MSLLSLKKSAPSASPQVMSLDAFIDDALHYAAGNFTVKAKMYSGLVNAPDRKQLTQDDAKQEHKRHATFSLDIKTIEQLTALSQETGISRSRLIRILVDEQSQRDCENVICSTVP